MAYGWTGRLLRVDLTSGKIEADDTLRYADYIGGRGIDARIGWDEIEPGTTAFDPENPLMFLSGPLTGHCHDDKNSFILEAYGATLLPDRATPTYTHPACARISRSTSGWLMARRARCCGGRACTRR